MGKVEHSVTLSPGCSAGCRPLMTSPLTSAPRLSQSTSLRLYPPNLLHLWQQRELPQRSEVPQRVTHLNIGVQAVSLCFFVLAGQLTAAEEPDDQRRDTRTKSLKLSLSQVRGRKASRRQESVVDETGSEWSLMDFNVFVFF